MWLTPLPCLTSPFSNPHDFPCTSFSWLSSYLSFQDPELSPTAFLPSKGKSAPENHLWSSLLPSIYSLSLGDLIQSHGFMYHLYTDSKIDISCPWSLPRIQIYKFNSLFDISPYRPSGSLRFNTYKIETQHISSYSISPPIFPSH